MSATLLPDRAVLRIHGEDRKSFLQGLITNDIHKLSPETPLYAALLNPQGKILFDFFLVEDGESILLDCWSEKAEALIQRLTMYKLRAKASIVPETELKVYADFELPLSGFIDPRHPQLGQRLITPQTLASSPPETYHLHRLSLGIPDSSDFIEERSFPIEFGLGDLNAISYTKGCYVGQEVVARSKTRGTINKALHRVIGPHLPPPGTPLFAGEAEVGIMRSSMGEVGLAVIRLEAATQITGVTASLPLWFSLPTPVMQTP
jgi:tRNA-modifying protein YgfZ